MKKATGPKNKKNEISTTPLPDDITERMGVEKMVKMSESQNRIVFESTGTSLIGMPGIIGMISGISGIGI